MCFFSKPKAQAPAILDTGDRRAAAATDAAESARANAQGYGQSIFGGMSTAQPSLAKKILLGTGS